jgi:hypothetical protein
MRKDNSNKIWSACYSNEYWKIKGDFGTLKYSRRNSVRKWKKVKNSHRRSEERTKI